MNFNDYLETKHTSNLDIIERIKRTTDRLYEESKTLYSEEKAKVMFNLEALKGDLKQLVYTYVNSTPSNPSAIESEANRIYLSFYRQGGSTPYGRLLQVLQSLESPSSIKTTSSDISVRHGTLFMAMNLWGILHHYNAQSAGFMFEYFISGILGQNAYVPADNKAADVIYAKESEQKYYSLKLLANSKTPIKTGRTNVIDIIQDVNNAPDIDFVVGIKEADDQLRVFIFDGTGIFQNAFLNDSAVSTSIQQLSSMPSARSARMVKKSKETPEEEDQEMIKVNPKIKDVTLKTEFNINFKDTIETLQSELTSQIVQVVNDTYDFLDVVKKYVTNKTSQREKSKEKIKTAHEKIGTGISKL